MFTPENDDCRSAPTAKESKFQLSSLSSFPFAHSSKLLLVRLPAGIISVAELVGQVAYAVVFCLSGW